MLLAVDPGIRGCGCAVFAQHILVQAAYVINPESSGGRAAEAAAMAQAVVDWVDDHGVNELAVEWPQVYASRIRGGSMAGQDPNDLLPLAGIDAALTALLHPAASSYLPSEWKGQMTKEACHERIRSRLSPAELAVMDGVKGAKAHNAYDAIGIGLFYLKRFDKRRVIPS